jgi:hypothetical protein
MAALVLANKSADAKGLLPPPACKQAGSATVTCTAPVTGISGVVFQTYPSQQALYTAYMAKVASLTPSHQFRQNFRDCESQATYGEVGWNHLFQHTSKYTVPTCGTGGSRSTTTSASAARRWTCRCRAHPRPGAACHPPPR